MASTNKKYFHDHLVLLLLSIAAFLTIAVSIFIAVKLGTGHSNTYIVQCRDCSNPSAINRFTSGGVGSLLSFIAFAIVVLISSTAISMRVYKIHRQLALTVLGLGVLLLILTVIVSNALLMLR
ncbi:MAG: hypothetical protein U0524_03330 [Candidatus Saccharimonadales bacterium]